MKLTLNVKQVLMVSKPTMVDSGFGKCSAPAGSIIVTLANDSRIPFRRDHFLELFPEADLRMVPSDGDSPTDAVVLEEVDEKPKPKPRPKSSR